MLLKLNSYYCFNLFALRVFKIMTYFLSKRECHKEEIC